jgi:hypothetical protein
MNFKTDDDKKDYIKSCVQRCLGHSDLYKYVGCYEDKEERDLPIRLGGGHNINPNDCFEEARKTKGIAYVGL